MSLVKKLSTIKVSSGAKKYLSNTSWLLAEKVLRMTVGLFIGIWVARYLGPEQFGLFSYAQSFVAIFAVISTFGLDNIVIRELVKDSNKKEKMLGTAFILKLLGACLVIILLSITLFFNMNDAKTNILIFLIASATIFQSFNVIDFYFQSQVLSKYVVYSNMLTLLLSSLLKVFLILNEAPLINFAYVVLFDSFVLALGFLFFYYKNELNFFSWSFECKTAKYLLKNSWPLILSSMVTVIYMKIDQVMLKPMLGNDAVGQYTAAVRLSEAWYFIPVVISASLFPAVINAKKHSESLYYQRLQNLYDLMAWMAISIAIPITFLSDWIIVLLYGDQFSEASSVLTLHIWCSVFVFIGVASSKWFVAEDLQKYTFYRALAGAIINVLLNIYLIPIYGIYGAALATLFAQIIASYLFNITNRKLRHTFILQTKALFFPIRKIKALF